MLRLVFLVLFIVSVIGCDRENRREEFASYDSSQYERVSINYEILGAQDTCLVFIHGWNLNMRYWDEQTKRLRDKYRILNLDLAGHGNSGRNRSNWTAESFARDITNILEKESVRNAILIGHSFGSDIALQVYEFAPDKVIGLIAVDAFKNVEFELTEDFKDYFYDHFNKFKRNYPQMSDEFARENIRSKNRTVINRIVKDFKSADPKVALAIYKNMVPKQELEKEKLQKLPFKLKIIASDYTALDENALKKYVPSGYEIIWIHDAGHFPMIEQPEQLNRALQLMLNAKQEVASPAVESQNGAGTK